ncbi:hypothetical protein J0A68_08710 [Algoriphagus sp. H41]|uniref:Uncharacterized protein n=1 Tax=Algoriphagus oliviformis TaxID=2811231 RepID=A0ABS3C347_9BACT|nr:hypothetical protein [Algoriphagus oliviformis]MBN7811034.1 hypothetical protein [Algoriphagus oliviformis]
MDYNQKLEQLLDFSLEDYPSSAYSLIEERSVKRSSFPEYYSYRYPEKPLYGLFEKIEVVTENYVTNRRISLIVEKFDLSQLPKLSALVADLVEIYGADEHRRLWLDEDEEEDIRLDQWEVRYWEFPHNQEFRDVFVYLKEQRLKLTIYERGNLLEVD